MITRRLSVTRIWRRFALAADSWSISDLASRTGTPSASDSFTISDAATHS